MMFLYDYFDCVHIFPLNYTPLKSGITETYCKTFFSQLNIKVFKRGKLCSFNYLQRFSASNLISFRLSICLQIHLNPMRLWFFRHTKNLVYCFSKILDKIMLLVLASAVCVLQGSISINFVNCRNQNIKYKVMLNFATFYKII